MAGSTALADGGGVLVGRGVLVGSCGALGVSEPSAVSDGPSLDVYAQIRLRGVDVRARFGKEEPDLEIGKMDQLFYYVHHVATFT